MKERLLLHIERDHYAVRMVFRNESSLWTLPLWIGVGVSLLVHILLLCSVHVAPYQGESTLSLRPLIVQIDLPSQPVSGDVPVPIVRFYTPNLYLVPSEDWNSSLSLCTELPPTIEYEPLDIDFDYD